MAAGKALSVVALAAKPLGAETIAMVDLGVPVAVLKRVVFEGGRWQHVELTATGVNGTLALLTDDPMVFVLDDVEVTIV